MLTDQAVIFTEEIKIYFCGREKCAPSHSFGPAVRSAYLLHFVLSGKGKFTRRSKTYSLSEGDYFLIKPDEITYYEADSDSPWEYAWISFSGQRADAALAASGLLEVPVGHAKNRDEFAARITELSDVYEESPHNTLELLKCAYGVLSLIVKKQSPDNAATDGYVKQAQKFIRHNFAFDIKIADIANHIGIDRTYLYKLFIRSEGISPKQYMTDYRLEKARLMLSGTDMSVSQAAASCGYPELAPFSRQFKAKFGVSPAEYRKQSNV